LEEALRLVLFVVWHVLHQENDMADPEKEKETIVVVHGTWAAPDWSSSSNYNWYEFSVGNIVTELFTTKLNAALQARGAKARCWAHCSERENIFRWSGANDWIARTQAAASLADYLTKLGQEGWRYHVIAHSHGGNIVVEALPQISGDRSLGSLITLGTPFMDVLAPIYTRTDKLEKSRNFGGWGMVVFVLAICFLFSLPSLLKEMDALFDIKNSPYAMVFVVSIELTFLVAFGGSMWMARRRAYRRKVAPASHLHQPLHAIGCPTDEAWQLLHHLPALENPLAVRSSLLRYIFGSVRARASRVSAAARIRGARSFRDVSYAGIFTAGVYYVGIILAITVVYLTIRDGRWLDAGITALFATSAAICIPLLLRMPLGKEFFSAIYSPLRWVAHGVFSLSTIGSAFGTYFIRRWSWPVLLRMIMGLDGYRYGVPVVSQFPLQLNPQSLVKYEDLSAGAEERALVRRSDWVARHLGDVSQTFAKLSVTTAETTELLRIIEQDQTLVHAAYYMDDDAIARIADLIAATGLASKDPGVDCSDAQPPGMQ
jgi:hypothetical protein